MNADCTVLWQHPDLMVAAEIVVVEGRFDNGSCHSADGSEAFVERDFPKPPEPEDR